MEFDEVLALRKSVRRYTKEIVSQEDEKAILDAPWLHPWENIMTADTILS